jgi:hypothetical protein
LSGRSRSPGCGATTGVARRLLGSDNPPPSWISVGSRSSKSFLTRAMTWRVRRHHDQLNKRGAGCTMHKDEGRKGVIDVLKKLWLVYGLTELVMHVCIDINILWKSSLRYLICI